MSKNKDRYDNHGFVFPDDDDDDDDRDNKFVDTDKVRKKDEEYARKQIKRLKRIIVALCAGVIGIILITDSFFMLDVEHSAVITTLGKPSIVSEPGLHLKIPFVQTVDKVDTTIKGMAIGYDIETNESIQQESVMISSDYNFIDVDFYITYQVTDPMAYKFNSDDPISIMKAFAQNSIRTVVASYKVDSVLTTGKGEIQSNTMAMLVQKVEEADLGITIKNVTIQDSEPPTDSVSEAFKAVETAKQSKETAINNANKYRNEQIPAAEANADQILQKAEADKQKRINEANGQVERFNKMYEEYTKFPLITKQRMFYETMEDVLPNLKVVIQGEGGSTMSTMLPLESFMGNTSTTTADTAETEVENSAEE